MEKNFNKSLINKIKNKIYEKIINSDYYLEVESDEYTLFKKASEFFKDEEFEKLRLMYNNFIKKY